MLNPTLLKLYKTPILLAFLSLLFYYLFAYDVVRTDYIRLISLYIGLFILFFFLIKHQKKNIRFLTFIALLFRLVFLFSIPNLSQDFYRFIWDGRMLIEGFNPYLATPEFFISKGEFPVEQAQELYNGMGTLNGSHYTNYPPLNQLCFVIAGLFASKSILGSVIMMRIIIIAADFGTLYFGKKLLKKLKLPVHTIFWYILNPFIIIELTGNLHFEAVMIFFLVWSLYLLHLGKWKLAGVIFSCSVSIKLIPLIFLPLFYQWFVKGKRPLYRNIENSRGDNMNVISNEYGKSHKEAQGNKDKILKQVQDEKEVSTALNLTKLIGFYSIIGIVTILLFAPFYSTQFINNYTETVGLWFKNFEFNASLYYIAREIGYLFRDYNEIAIIGKIIPVVVVLFVLIITFFRKNKTTLQLISAMLIVLSFYYFTATTVHPWYIATLLILSIFTQYKFPLVWSLVIILSYLAYTNSNNTENLWIIGLEYAIVYVVFIWEGFLKGVVKT